MKKLIASLILLIPVVSHPALATTAEERISDSCKRQASGLRGDQREEFLQECVQEKPVRHGAHARAPSCTTLAQDRRGDDRRDFLRKCRERYR